MSELDFFYFVVGREFKTFRRRKPSHHRVKPGGDEVRVRGQI